MALICVFIVVQRCVLQNPLFTRLLFHSDHWVVGEWEITICSLEHPAAEPAMCVCLVYSDPPCVCLVVHCNQLGGTRENYH